MIKPWADNPQVPCWWRELPALAKLRSSPQNHLPPALLCHCIAYLFAFVCICLHLYICLPPALLCQCKYLSAFVCIFIFVRLLHYCVIECLSAFVCICMFEYLSTIWVAIHLSNSIMYPSEYLDPLLLFELTRFVVIRHRHCYSAAEKSSNVLFCCKHCWMNSLVFFRQKRQFLGQKRHHEMWSRTR